MINDSKTVKNQYSSADNLKTRISIHDKYSTNKMGFGNWIYSNYKIGTGMKVLELGCGTGDMWLGHESIIKSCSELVISDFSEAMVDMAKTKIGQYDNTKYMTIDVQDIPYEDGHFDVVIANMMLYHVPYLNKGLSEIRRVLKDGGTFYCATYGEHGIIEYLSKLLSVYGVEDTTNKNFTLQNGAEILGNVFKKVERLDYKDSLEVTVIEDLVDYIYSLSAMTTLSAVPRDKISSELSSHMINGSLTVPKEYGMFIAQ